MWLADLGYRLDGWNEQGETPLHMGARRNMMALIGKAADQGRLGALSARQDSLLHAATIGSAEMTRFLIDHGVPLDRSNLFSHTPAQLAFWNKRLNELEALLTMGANPSLIY